jgi:hypothetical protein
LAGVNNDLDVKLSALNMQMIALPKLNVTGWLDKKRFSGKLRYRS